MLTGPPPPCRLPRPRIKHPFIVVSGLSENTQVYTAGVSVGYRISATVIRLRERSSPGPKLAPNGPELTPFTPTLDGPELTYRNIS